MCKEQWEQLKTHFNGKVYLLQDNGDTAIVLVDPADAGRFQQLRPPDSGEAWKRVNEPCLMLIDPSRAGYPRVVN